MTRYDQWTSFQGQWVRTHVGTSRATEEKKVFADRGAALHAMQAQGVCGRQVAHSHHVLARDDLSNTLEGGSWVSEHEDLTKTELRWRVRGPLMGQNTSTDTRFMRARRATGSTSPNTYFMSQITHQRLLEHSHSPSSASTFTSPGTGMNQLSCGKVYAALCDGSTCVMALLCWCANR